MRVATWGAMAAALSMVACRDDGRSTNRKAIEAAAHVTLSVESAAFINAVCERAMRCDEESALFTDLNGCYLALTVTLGCSELDEYLAGKDADACLAAIHSARCDGYVLSDEATEGCASLFGQTGKKGDGCGGINDPECGTGLYCTASESDCGECRKLPSIGDPCPDYECEVGAYCQDRDKTCHAMKDDGSSCTPWSGECQSGTCVAGKCVTPAEGDLCSDSDEEEDMCGSTLVCINGKCSPPLPLGASCNGEWECVADAVCVEGKCETIKVCGELGRGEECSPSLGGQCEEGLLCNRILFSEDPATCEPPAKEGEACFETLCADGLYCDLSSRESNPVCRSESDAPLQCGGEAKSRRSRYRERQGLSLPARLRQLIQGQR